MPEYPSDPVRGRPADRDDDPPVPDLAGLPPDDPQWRPSAPEALWEQFGPALSETPRDQLWFPHLLVRSTPGDTGQRPVWEPVPCWASPDIHLLPAGERFDLSRTVQSPRVGSAYTVAVHVWNLGRFPAHGVAVRAWWVEPGFFDGTTDPRYRPRFIGGTMTELGDRDSAGEAHRIVEIPTPWVVEDQAEGHECLFAAVEAFADPWSGRFTPNEDRHVAQRNLTLLRHDDDASGILGRLDVAVDVGGEVGLHVGTVGAGSLVGAAARGLSSTTDTRLGHGPVSLGAHQRLTRFSRHAGGWTDEVSGARPETLTLAVLGALGATRPSAAGLLAGTVLGGRRSAALHLSTATTGYTLMLHE